MGELKISCYCDEVQMENIVKFVTTYLAEADTCELSDIDDEIEGVRVCVDFDVCMDEISIRCAEIMDGADWDVLPEDSAVLASRLRMAMRDYCRELDESFRQAQQIEEDCHQSILYNAY